MDPVLLNVADAKALLEARFGNSKIPAKYLHLLDWWSRLLVDPSAPPRMRLACERDLDEVLGPLAPGAVWVMTANPDGPPRR